MSPRPEDRDGFEGSAAPEGAGDAGSTGVPAGSGAGRSGGGRKLTRREFEEVMRRAVELTETEAASEDRELSEAEVLRIAGEVGLPEAHVRRALLDVRAQPPPRGTLHAIFGAQSARASRVVRAPRGELARTIDDFMVAGHLMHPVRRSQELMLYRPASDWVSGMARAMRSTSRQYYWSSAKHVEVRLQEVEPEVTLVEIEVDPGSWGNNVAGGLIAGLGGGVGAGVGIGTLAVAVAPLALAAAAGAVVGASVGGGITWATGRHHRNRMEEVRTELEGVLDQLESGQGLEPAPPSWRRWVQRQARAIRGDFMGVDESDRKGGGS